MSTPPAPSDVPRQGPPDRAAPSNVVDLFTRRLLPPPESGLPQPRECIACFVERCLVSVGCTDDFAVTEEWQRQRARRATRLLSRLRRLGAVCDCTIALNVWEPAPDLWDWDPEATALSAPVQLPPCRGSRPNSTQPCSLWIEVDGFAG